MNNFDGLINLIALTYFKENFDVEKNLKEISETDWEILDSWEQCQNVTYEEILNNLLEKIKKQVKELKGE